MFSERTRAWPAPVPLQYDPLDSGSSPLEPLGEKKKCNLSIIIGGLNLEMDAGISVTSESRRFKMYALDGLLTVNMLTFIYL